MKKNTWNTTAFIATCGLTPCIGLSSMASAQECVVDFDFTTSVGSPGLRLGAIDDDGSVGSFGIFDDGSGSGPALYASGDFDNSGGAQIRGHLAKWDGAQWNEVFPALFDGTGKVIVTHNDGTGEAMYIGGSFSTVGFFVDADGICKWDGTTWSAVGPHGPGNGFLSVEAIAFYDDGTGETVYVAANYQTTNNQGRAGVFKLMNDQWVQVGLNFAPSATELKVFDDGNGERLFAAGAFQPFAGTVQASRVAVLNTSGQWENVGGAAIDGSVTDMEVWDDGTGPALYIGGPNFFHAGTVDAIKVAKWDGSQWSALGSAGGLANGVFDLEIWDDGTGEALYATGFVWAEVNPDGDTIQPLSSIAKWNGQTWSSTVPNIFFGSFTDGNPEVMKGFDDGNGPGLFIGGPFNHIRTVENGNLISNPATHVTVVRGCTSTVCTADLTGDGLLNFFDVSAFLSAFSAGDMVADFTGDGLFNFFDVSAFLSAFSAGCP